MIRFYNQHWYIVTSGYLRKFLLLSLLPVIGDSPGELFGGLVKQAISNVRSTVQVVDDGLKFKLIK
jgi:hypothetical protein